VPIKRHELLLQALALLASINRRLNFSLSVMDRRVKACEKVGSLSVSKKKVQFHGFRQDLEEIYRELDLVILCSANEGMPVCLIEAMSRVFLFWHHRGG